ncbi:glycosyltransferase involved in cell wall biosynthesis [Pedobacter sp. CG_S7]|uniref:glycosyltransferase n=1 Tax=Pedobacter sp. CG_S7 TaxID=3143930 RepID=UPI003396C0CE
MITPSAPIIVSICCITYNHEQYISQTLDGFLMQKTNFNVEILIGEDCSTDTTKSIIEDYCNKYPGKIKLITYEKNIGSIRNHNNIMKLASGKYIAMCDGDDFWTHPLKLQKQVDFLEQNHEYVICCHYTKVIDEKDQVVYLNLDPVKLEYDYADVLLGKKEETRLCSLVVRNLKEIREINSKVWYLKVYGADKIFKIYAVASTNKKMYVLPEVMGCYRLHSGGVWSMIDTKLRKSRMISDFNLVIRNFNYSNTLKRSLLKIYIRDYFLFEVKNLRLNSAVNTIIKLL